VVEITEQMHKVAEIKYLSAQSGNRFESSTVDKNWRTPSGSSVSEKRSDRAASPPWLALLLTAHELGEHC